MRVIDLFSGMGGFSYGFKQSNFQIDQGIDSWDKALKSYSTYLKAQILHPEENRVISIAEALGLQDFPNWYVPFGSDSDKAIQIANAIPPGVSKAIAEKIFESI